MSVRAEAAEASLRNEPGCVARLISRWITFIIARLRGQSTATPRVLGHVETLSLGPKRQVFLIECDGERFLIAGGSDCLSAPVLLAQRFAAGDEERLA